MNNRGYRIPEKQTKDYLDENLFKTNEEQFLDFCKLAL